MVAQLNMLALNRCQACGTKRRPLYSHHRQYRGTVFKETVGDLVLLCPLCHSQAEAPTPAGKAFHRYVSGLLLPFGQNPGQVDVDEG